MTVGNKTLFTVTLGVFVLVSSAYAHPGNTAADGCHYCRTNCDKWGEVWDERHCHGGGVVQPPATKKPTPVPTKVVTPTPLPTKVITLTPLPSPSPSPTPEGEVLGTADESTPTPTPSPSLTPEVTNTPAPVATTDSSDDGGSGGLIAAIVALAAGGGVYALYRWKKGA